MDIQYDGLGQPYIDVENVRVTLIRREDAGWAGSGPYLRVQAYRGEGQSLHPGAELPLSSDQAALKLIAAIAALATSP